MKKYIRPKFTLIKISCEDLLGYVPISGEGEADAKAQNFRIFDDSDDLSEEDY